LTPKAAGQPDPDGHNAFGSIVPRGLYSNRRTAVNYFNADQIKRVFSRSEEETTSRFLQHPVITASTQKRANAAFIEPVRYISDYDRRQLGARPKIQVDLRQHLDVLPVVSSDHKYSPWRSVRRPCVAGRVHRDHAAPRVLSTGNGAFLLDLPVSLELPKRAGRTMRSSV